MIDFLVTLLIVLVIFAVVSYVVTNFVPMAPTMKQLVVLVIGAIFLIWLLLALAGSVPLWHTGALERAR